ncbi:efflux RND transporter periplasmic adaptor subunit [Salinibacterium sp. PAMC 21357]|uniref:efflux RND transporter periplasmic adaptor subunit n=1 Tax=Salinibacterium sp. PAMC 21357 TaxID=1112215 RepID=UPI000287B877|nr:efflux RND transporter periplasmic adaptor subunit [Salinibacterium sp. PAMC 21357]
MILYEDYSVGLPSQIFSSGYRVSVARRWVFPIIWMIIFSVIAAALVKFAFFGDALKADQLEYPTVAIEEPHYEVVAGTITNNVELTGNVAAAASIPIPATLSGEVREVLVSAGQAVEKDQAILKLRAEVVNPDGTAGTQWKVVVAPAAGLVTDFTTLVGASFQVGSPVGQISPQSYTVSGTVPSEQLYRLVDRPSEASVAINGGPAPFTCTGLSITFASTTATAGESAEGPTVSCAVPSDIVVFPGLTAQLTIAGGIAEDVMVVPITAVEGTAVKGNVYFVLPDGTTELREVVLGLNDGISVEVVSGLEAGDAILQFVPGAEALDEENLPENCYKDGDDVVCY